ncbi:MAG: hypothetical protein CMI85_05675 [Candidatus Pelagibacter sp.]|nr:hypothetical protein [Candidatus Pelagibacter sp.]|tara:strand:- start:21879 stop:22331 length:453 start_codon:yes stop_codon:yes gene_type:complete
MLSDKEKKFFENKIKNVSSTNQKISILLNEKLRSDLKNIKKIKTNLKYNIKKCDNILYLYNVADDMWFLAGDKSTDYNFYTKRIILSSILSKLYIKILTTKSYNDDLLSQDVNIEISKVGKFNKLKSDLLSLLNNIKNFTNKDRKSKRGY